jgi:hypothetical protein
VSRWKLYGNWCTDLRGLTVERFLQRHGFAEHRQRQALSLGMARSSKAAREWRSKRQAVEEELGRWGVTP